MTPNKEAVVPEPDVPKSIIVWALLDDPFDIRSIHSLWLSEDAAQPTREKLTSEVREYYNDPEMELPEMQKWEAME